MDDRIPQNHLRLKVCVSYEKISILFWFQMDRGSCGHYKKHSIATVNICYYSQHDSPVFVLWRFVVFVLFFFSHTHIVFDTLVIRMHNLHLVRFTRIINNPVASSVTVAWSLIFYWLHSLAAHPEDVARRQIFKSCSPQNALPGTPTCLRPTPENKCVTRTTPIKFRTKTSAVRRWKEFSF